MRKWIQQGHDDRQTSYFVTAYRTLIDAYLTASNSNSSTFEFGAEAPAELTGGISLGGVGDEWGN